MKNRILLSVGLLLMTMNLWAQKNENDVLQISGYAEIYYQYDFNNPKQNTRPPFVYSHNRNKEVNVNLAFLKATYDTENIRANLALATGTYMNANYAAEQGVLKNIYEVNVGVKISRKHNLWIDAGVMPSHLGFESAAGKDNWTLTRSLFAENSPYFETGAKISYATANGKWFVSGLFLNGWQRIQRVDGNSTPAFGHQLLYKPDDKWTINSGSFLGNDEVDSLQQMRYFHNLYTIYQANDKMGFIVGIDIGIEEAEKSKSGYYTWFTPVVMARYSATKKINVTARAEYYQDRNAVIVSTGALTGFHTLGFSLNGDYNIMPNFIWRTEIRNLNSTKDFLFIDSDNGLKNNSLTATTALALSF